MIPVALPGGKRERRSCLRFWPQPPGCNSAIPWKKKGSIASNPASSGSPPGPGPGQALFEGECPYRGLQAFRPEHTAFIAGFGTPDENRFLAVVGASGSGKFSLVRTGLIPAIRQGRLEGSGQWPIILCRPSYDPLQELATALYGSEAIRTQHRLTQSAREWREKADESYLYTGALLAQAEEWEKQHETDLNDLEREFLDASIPKRDRQRREEAETARRLFRRTAAGAVVAVVLMLVAVWMAWMAEEQKEIADSARDEALEKTREAERSLANNYWASGIRAEKKNDPVTAAHFFAGATQKYSEKTGELELRTDTSFPLYRCVLQIYGMLLVFPIG
uniref:Novel STAND NTPase 1 domain-containing protein n=1 Tax=Candidatus Kentrum sp. FW TaxID=2126338 RepID=A0A450SHF1_9GAMM|nr:MAG: hypothetical protein BECKFW1821B_GA0114236_101249 [Candidatus Kentron sp. FW]